MQNWWTKTILLNQSGYDLTFLHLVLMCILSTSGLGILQWHVVLVWRCDRVTFIHPKRWGIGPKSSYIEWEKKIHEKKIAILQKTLRHYGWELEETLQRKCLRNVWTPWAIENALGELWDHHWAWRTQSCYCNFEIHDNSEKMKSKWTSENTHPRVKNPKALWVQKANGIWIILEGTKLHYQRFK